MGSNQYTPGSRIPDEPQIALFHGGRGCIYLGTYRDDPISDMKDPPWSVEGNSFDSARSDESSFIRFGFPNPVDRLSVTLELATNHALTSKVQNGDNLWFAGDANNPQKSGFWPGSQIAPSPGPCDSLFVPSQVPKQPLFPIPLYLPPGDPAQLGIAQGGSQGAIGLPGPVAHLQERIARLSVLRTRV